MTDHLRSLCFFSILLALFLVCTAEKAMPKQGDIPISESCAKKLQKESHTKLPPEITVILNRDYPGWVFSEGCSIELNDPSGRQHSPHFIWGDFDSNGHKDYAVLIGNGGKWSLLAFFKKNGEFKAHILEAYHSDNARYADRYLLLHKKGEAGAYYNDFDEQKPFVYPHDSIESLVLDKGGVSYIFKQGSFQELITGD